MVKNADKFSQTSLFTKKFEILVITFILISTGFAVIGVFPGLAIDNEIINKDSGEPRSLTRAPRALNYDMNLSRPGFHQDLTIYGAKGLSLFENIPPLKNITMGDVTGDGYDDLIIGAPYDYVNPALEPGMGIIYVIFGNKTLPSTYDLAQQADLTIYGNATNLEGTAVAVGDIDGDNIQDLIANAIGIGDVHVFYGGNNLKNQVIWDLNTKDPDLIIHGNVTDLFGASLAVSDLNGDNFDDIIIGSPLGYRAFGDLPGLITILYGNSSFPSYIDVTISMLPSGVYITLVYGVDGDDRFGTVVASGADFNGDGLNDIAVTAPYGRGGPPIDKPNTGEAYILYGRKNMPSAWDLKFSFPEPAKANITIYGNQSNNFFGDSNIVFGDINGDNFADVLLGAPNVDDPEGPADIGSTYAFYGSSAYGLGPYTWDIATPEKRANVTILFEDAYDFSGTWVEAFDWNTDGYDDILIGAPNGDGPNNNYQDVGELVIINGSSNLQKYIKLKNFKPSYYFYGADNNDTFSRSITHGDIDGDSIPDLAVLADKAYGFNNNKKLAGDIYVIRGARSLAPGIDSIKVRNGDGPTGQTCYTRYKPYEFELNISARLGINDLTNVTLTLDPSGLNLSYYWAWSGSVGTFQELNDPNDYAELSSLSKEINDNDQNWTISFNITFNWTCPRGNLLPIRVELWNKYLFQRYRDFLDIFKIENRLNFTGQLVVKDSQQSILADNAWIRGGESLTWTNLTVVYENTTDIYPNSTEYEVKLWNATKSWSDTSPTGSSINIISQAGPNSLSTDTYILNITKIPTANDVSNITFNLRIDAEDIGFATPVPTPGVWQTESPLSCGITITDHGGTQVDASSVQYRKSFNNGLIWMNWTSAGLTTNNNVLQVNKDIYFEDGPDNLLQWRGNDTVGNGYAVSAQYSVKVDTENVTFDDPTPMTGATLEKLTVDFSIYINDSTSGVNASTIEYDISYDDGGYWLGWENLGLTGIHSSVYANATHEFKLGSNNLVKWRAKDAAGNGPTESTPQRIEIFIATFELKTYLLEPYNNTEVPNSTKTLSWTCSDNSSNIEYEVYLDTDYQKVINPKRRGEVRRNVTKDQFHTIGIKLVDGLSYFWTVIPRNVTGKVGVCVDGVWKFTINPEAQELTKPVIELKNPRNNANISTLKPTFIWILRYKTPTGIVFDLNLGKAPDNLDLKVTDITDTEYTWTESLENHTTYYWNISVHGGDLDRTYYSPLYRFHTKWEPGVLYDFSLTAAKNLIQIKQGTNGSFSFDIENLRTSSGTVELTVELISDDLSLSMFSFSESSVGLTAKQKKSVTLTIIVPSSLKTGLYQYTVVGTMDTRYGSVIKKIDPYLLLNVTSSKEEVPDEEGEKEPTEDNTMLYAGIAGIIIVIVVLLILFMLIRRKKKKEEERPEEEAEEHEERAPPAAVPMAAPVAMPVAKAAIPVAAEPAAEPTEPVEPTPEEPIAEAEPPVEAAPPAATPVPAEPMPATPVVEESAPEEAEQPSEIAEPAAETPPAAEAVPEEVPETAEPEMPSDLPPDAYEKPPTPPPAAAPVAEPPKTEPAAPTPEPTEPNKVEAEAQPKPKPEDAEEIK